MTNDSITVRFYHGTYCTYCTYFKPTWNLLKNYTNYNGVDIKYEEKDIEQCSPSDRQDIVGVPSVVFLYKDKRQKFNKGERSLENLKEAINEFIDNRNNMSGGGISSYKHDKYVYKSLQSLTNYYNIVYKSKGIDNEDEEYRLKCLKMISNMVNSIN